MRFVVKHVTRVRRRVSAVWLTGAPDEVESACSRGWSAGRRAVRIVGDPPTSEEFPSQADAESWLGEQRSLLASGVARVTLSHDGRAVYGPMSLDAP